MARHRRTALLTAAVLLLLLIGTAPALAGKPGTTLPACPSTFTLSGRSSLTRDCLWTPTQVAELGRVQVEVTKGALVRLTIMVRDYAPGDYCTLTPYPDDSVDSDWVTWETRFAAGSILQATFPLVIGDRSYIDFPVDWCGTAFHDQDPPLYLKIGAMVDSRSELKVTLTP